jgi:uncharacterized protein (TIGR02246 family)
MKSLLEACLTLVLVLGLYTTGHAQTEADERKIRAIAVRWEQAWNSHDMKALAVLVTDEADFVNVGARHWKGRNEIQAEHAARLGQFRESVWTNKGVTVQFLKPDIAIVHITWSMRGDKDPDGTARPPREGLFTWVVVQQGGDWLIRAAQNTNRGNLPSPMVK